LSVHVLVVVQQLCVSPGPSCLSMSWQQHTSRVSHQANPFLLSIHVLWGLKEQNGDFRSHIPLWPSHSVEERRQHADDGRKRGACKGALSPALLHQAHIAGHLGEGAAGQAAHVLGDIRPCAVDQQCKNDLHNVEHSLFTACKRQGESCVCERDRETEGERDYI
jgi:hypothetical protein